MSLNFRFMNLIFSEDAFKFLGEKAFVFAENVLGNMKIHYKQAIRTPEGIANGCLSIKAVQNEYS